MIYLPPEVMLVFLKIKLMFPIKSNASQCNPLLFPSTICCLLKIYTLQLNPHVNSLLPQLCIAFKEREMYKNGEKNGKCPDYMKCKETPISQGQPGRQNKDKLEMTQECERVRNRQSQLNNTWEVTHSWIDRKK